MERLPHHWPLWDHIINKREAVWKVQYQMQQKLEIEESTKVYLIGSMAYNRWVSFQMNPHPTSVL